MLNPARYSAAALIAALAIGIIACGGDVVVDSPLMVRDSAGIEIVENLAQRWTSSANWQLSGEPVVTIGDLGQDLFRVTGARRLSDGRIVVTNRGTYELRFFTPQVQVHQRNVDRGADTIVVHDSRSLRLSRFLASGEFSRRTNIPGR